MTSSRHTSTLNCNLRLAVVQTSKQSALVHHQRPIVNGSLPDDDNVRSPAHICSPEPCIAFAHVDAGSEGIVSKLAVHDALIRALPHHAWEVWALTDSLTCLLGEDKAPPQQVDNKWDGLPHSGTMVFLLMTFLCPFVGQAHSAQAMISQQWYGCYPARGQARPELRSLLGPFYFGKLRQQTPNRSL